MKDYTFPVDRWNIIEEKFDISRNCVNESIFTLGNGYIGLRGNFEEGYQGLEDTSLEGTYINGFYEIEPIFYSETAYGYARNNQTMLNVTNSKIIEVYVDDEKFSMFNGKIINHRRILDMKHGLLKRLVHWRSSSGKELEINTTRIVSFTNRHLVLIHYEIKAVNFNGNIRIASVLDGNVSNQRASSDPRFGSALSGQVLKVIEKVQSGDFTAIIQKTQKSKLTLVCAMKSFLNCINTYKSEEKYEENKVSTDYIVSVNMDEKIILDKYIVYYTSRDCGEESLTDTALKSLNQAGCEGFESLLKRHENYMEEFWNKADIQIYGDDALQQGIRFNMFHLLQAAGRDGNTSICAKGLTGEGYEGHYFWDTEIFVLPFFTYTMPQISRSILMYRYNTLHKARERARELAHDKGALYPWRTINGEECSAYYPAGTAQYHINADIIYALKQYIESTCDIKFMLDFGAEMLFETARLWADMGSYIPRRGNKFYINCVTGPDEYTAIVNNNCYTNYMAKMNLKYAADTAEWIKKENPVLYKKLSNKIRLEEEEITEWKKASENIYLPYDQKLKIHPQDDSFLDKEIWDFKNTPMENYPLLLHYHPLVIYRHQVCKQADTVLVEFLLGSEFSMEDKRRDYDYYEPITTHDSSLSECIYSIMACETGYLEKAYDYFMNSAREDLDNLHNNTQYGVHTACMAGTWACVLNGFAGMRLYEGNITFNPLLPEKWEKYMFKIRFKDKLLEVEVYPDRVSYRLVEGTEMEFIHRGKSYKIKNSENLLLE